MLLRVAEGSSEAPEVLADPRARGTSSPAAGPVGSARREAQTPSLSLHHAGIFLTKILKHRSSQNTPSRFCHNYFNRRAESSPTARGTRLARARGCWGWFPLQLRCPRMTLRLRTTLVSFPALKINGCAKLSARVLFTVTANT